MTNILASDILIADVITNVQGNAKLEELTKKYKLAPGGKTALTLEQFNEFAQAVEGHPITIMPGGSAANTLTTMSKLLGDKVDSQFIGITGKGMYSNMIKNSLTEAKVKLIPEKIPQGAPAPEAALSYVLVFPGGERSIVTYPGNARDILKPQMVTDDLVKKTDVVLVQGSLWQKLDWEFADKLLKERWNHDKELWLTLPTQAKFGEEKADHFKWLINSADVVLSNEEELTRIYKTHAADAAVKELQHALKRQSEIKKEQGKSQRREPVGFITCGSKGAIVVTANEIVPVDNFPVRKEDKVNTLGAGDTAFAGFAAGHLLDLPYTTCAQMGMALAAEKIKFNGARLPDPKAALKKASPYLSKLVEEKQKSQSTSVSM